MDSHLPCRRQAFVGMTDDIWIYFQMSVVKTFNNLLEIPGGKHSSPISFLNFGLNNAPAFLYFIVKF
ncbi:MAG: hypothetical protein C4539_16270 [Ignavibacteriales bacterium]|nr:MAG: hypothetical protein C4539_16270 [Ignavibacteriales bacterium]